MKKTITKFAIITVLVLSLCACGASTDKRIIGTWHMDTETSRYGFYELEFFDDGTFWYDLDNGKGGHWSLVNGNQLKLVFDEEWRYDPILYTVDSVTSKELRLTDETTGMTRYLPGPEN